jgi:hypothetical protein
MELARLLRRLARPEFQAAGRGYENTERTQFGAQHSDFKEHLVVKTDPISGQGSQANDDPRQPACGRLAVEIRMDNGMTGIRASQPGLIVTDGRQIHGSTGLRNAA